LFDIGSVLGVAVLRVRSSRLLDERTVEEHLVELYSGQFIESPLILDLMNVQQCSVTFASRLLKFAQRRLRSRQPTVIYMARPEIQEVFGAIDRKQHLPMFNTYTEALNSMGKIAGSARPTPWFAVLRSFWNLYYKPAAAFMSIAIVAAWVASFLVRTTPATWAMGL